MKKRMFALAAAVLLVCAMALTGAAHEVPDLERAGSISLVLKDGDKEMTDGTLTFYRVGEIRSQDGDYEFYPTGDFSRFDGSLMGEYTKELAKALLEFASSNQLQGQTVQIKDGAVRYQLPKGQLGLYLVAQHTPSTGYQALDPFLISVPGTEDGQYVYDVNAEPKIGQLHPQETTIPPTTAPNQDPQLPQTGQMKLPVPVLAVLGLCLIGGGIVLFAVEKKKSHE